MNKSISRAALTLLTLACCAGGAAATARKRRCGPDAYAPVVFYTTTHKGHKRRVVRRPRKPYEAYTATPLEMASTPFLGVDSVQKFDEYGLVNWCAAEAYLDNFAIALQNSPGEQGYIVVYGKQGDKKAEETKRLWGSFTKSYLVDTRGIDAKRLVTVNGGFRSDFTNVLLIAPRLEYKLDARVDPPNAECRPFNAEGYAACAPSNWRRLTQRGITFAPSGAFRGPGVFTHGVEFITVETGADLRQDAKEFVGGLVGFDPGQADFQETNVAGRKALVTELFRTDEESGLHLRTRIYFVPLDARGSGGQQAAGRALYVITTAPTYEYDGYQETFSRILQSIKPGG